MVILTQHYCTIASDEELETFIADYLKNYVKSVVNEDGYPVILDVTYSGLKHYQEKLRKAKRCVNCGSKSIHKDGKTIHCDTCGNDDVRRR